MGASALGASALGASALGASALVGASSLGAAGAFFSSFAPAPAPPGIFGNAGLLPAGFGFCGASLLASAALAAAPPISRATPLSAPAASSSASFGLP